MTDIVQSEPRALSQAEYEQWVASATAHEQEIKAGLKEVRGGLWRAAKALYAFNEESGWQALGYETLGEWLGDPDVTMTRATFYRMLSAWQEFHIHRHVDESKLRTLDLTKAAIALPALKRGETTVEDVLGDTEALGARDMRLKYGRIIEVEPEADLGGEIYDGDGDGDESTPNVETPDVPYDDEPASYGDETVPRGVAETLVAVLEAILREVGAPERKAMSKKLRDQVTYALELAKAEGLGVGA